MNGFVDPEEHPSFWDGAAIQAAPHIPEEDSECGSEPIRLRGMGVSAPPSSNVERIDTIAPMPFLRRGKPVDAFFKLKSACQKGAGFDFLAVCGDVMRDRNFQSNKPGVASKSRHKCGQAFDYNQADKHLIIVSEPKDGEQYFRTWLKCDKQDGSQGTKVALKDIRGFKTNVYSWDFTKAAESLGWKRIPAWDGWERSYTKKEFWHYQLTEGTTYQQAIDFLYKNNTPEPVVDLTVLKLGSKGDEVKLLQTQLHQLGFLPTSGIDDKFGPRTEAAVKAFQKANGLRPDGEVGPLTRNKLNQLIEEKKKMGFDYDSDEVNAAVAAEADENSTPKPFFATSQFAVLLATYVLGPVAMWLAAKGVITPDQAPALVGIFQTAIVAGMAFITKQYISGRNEVSAIKARAAAARSLSAHGPEAVAALRALDRS